jgi:hypothetical protein
MFRCATCKLFLVGETHKGHTYYRCHRKQCWITSVRQEKIEIAILDLLKRVNIGQDEEPALKAALDKFRKNESEVANVLRRELEEEHEHIQRSIKVLLQKFLDNAVPKETFDEGHNELLMQRRTCEDKLARFNTDEGVFEKATHFISRLRTVCERFCTGTPDELRVIVDEISQSISVDHREVQLVPKPVIGQIASRVKTEAGWDQLLTAVVRACSDVGNLS